MNKKLLIAPICGIAMVIGGAFLLDVAPSLGNGAFAILLCGCVVSLTGAAAIVIFYK